MNSLTSQRRLYTNRLLPILTAIGLSAMVLPAQAAYEDSCKPPKTNYSQVSCTDVGTLFMAYNQDYQPQALLNQQGKVIASLKGYQSVDAWGFKGDHFAVQKNGKVGYMNTQGKLVIPTIYDRLQDPDNKYDETWANPVTNNRIVVAKNGKYGVIDTNNKTIVPFNNKYEYIDNFSEGMAAVQSKAGKWGFINLEGKEVIAPQFDGLDGSLGGYYGFNEGLVGVFNGKKWGFITKSGKVAVPFLYDEIRPFSEGLAGVRKDNKWGFVNGANKTIIPFQYSDSNIQRLGVNYLGATYFNFVDGQATVATINDNDICINKSNKKVTCQQ